RRRSRRTIQNSHSHHWRGRRTRTILTALMLGLAATSAPAESITATLSDAYTNSGLIDRNRATLRAADEEVAQAVALLRPSLNYAVSTDYSRTPSLARESLTASFTIAASLTLHDFGRNELAVESQKELVLATRQSLLSVEQQVLFTAVTAFFDVREAIETVALRENNVRLITQELRAAEDRFEVGEVTRTDVAIAQSRLAAARASLAAAQGDLLVANANFTEAVGRAPGPLVQPSSLPRVPANVDAAKGLARQLNPSLRQAQHAVTAAELGLERARRAVYPTVSGTASNTLSFSDDSSSSTRTSSVGVEISGPISQGGRLNSLAREAFAVLDQSRADVHLATLSADRAVDAAYANLAVARAQNIATDEQIRAATVAFRGVREEATLGARTTLDVLDAEQELLDARAAKVSAVAAEFRAAYGVLQATGQLTAQSLQLPVQLYDPAGYYRLVDSAPQYLPKSPAGQQVDRILESLGKN
ncbi:MAG: TolC family outer membrane protein, partial [Pseudomonadota bacterium]